MTEKIELGISVGTPRINLETESPSRRLTLDISNRSGEGGTRNYNQLMNKPSIEGHTLQGDSTLPQIGVGTITPQDIDRLIYG